MHKSNCHLSYHCQIVVVLIAKLSCIYCAERSRYPHRQQKKVKLISKHSSQRQTLLCIMFIFSGFIKAFCEPETKLKQLFNSFKSHFFAFPCWLATLCHLDFPAELFPLTVLGCSPKKLLTALFCLQVISYLSIRIWLWDLRENNNHSNMHANIKTDNNTAWSLTIRFIDCIEKVGLIWHNAFYIRYNIFNIQCTKKP